MRKNRKQIEQRRDLVNLAMNYPDEAAKVIKAKARTLGKATTTTQVVKAVADILYLSEATIFREIS